MAFLRQVLLYTSDLNTLCMQAVNALVRLHRYIVAADVAVPKSYMYVLAHISSYISGP